MSTERSYSEHDTSAVTEADSAQQAVEPAPRRLSPDTWAVLLALTLAALVKLHILNTVKW